MSFEEAFNIEADKGATKLELNENAFKKGAKLETEVSSKLREVQNALDKIGSTMKKDLSPDEIRAANLFVERSLEAEIPNTFKHYYKHAETGAEAAEHIQRDILNGVNSFIDYSLKNVIRTVDDASWVYNVNRKDIAKIAKKLDPSITKDDIRRLQDAYAGTKTNHLTGGGQVLAKGGMSQSKKQMLDDIASGNYQ